MKPIGILLCGGESKRMARPKGLLDFFGVPWIMHQLKSLNGAGLEKIIVVLGKDAPLFYAALPILRDSEMAWITSAELPQLGGIMTIQNPAPEQGAFSSLLSGIACALPLAKSAFVLPVDVPCPSVSVLSSLNAALKGEVQVAVPQYQAKSGHPVLLGVNLLHKLMFVSLSQPDARLDLQIKKLPPHHYAAVPVDDEGILMNLNDETKWNAFVASRQSKHP